MKLRQPVAAALGAVALLVAVGTAHAQSPASVVRFPFPQDEELTPYTFDLGYPLVTLLYDTVTWRDPDGVPQPWLATSIDSSADGKRLTVHLHDGVHWQDGQDLTSADVAFTYGYVASHPHPWFTAEVAPVLRVETPDPLTAVFVLSAPSPGFLDQPLADVPILPRHLWQSLPAGQAAPAGLPVGSGPYRLTAHDPGKGYTFTAFDGYFLGPPVVQELDVSVQNDATKAVDGIAFNRFDMVPAALPDAEVTRLQQLGAKLIQGPSYEGVQLLFNTRRAPLDTVTARSAVSLALDPVRLAKAVRGAVPAAAGILHPASPWAAGAPPHQFDESEARAELGALHLPTLDVVAPDYDSDLVETARQVAFALGRVGVNAQAKTLPKADYERALGEGGGDPTFTLAVWKAPPFPSYDPDFLAREFGSNPAVGRLDFTGYRSARFDDAARRVATAGDPAARAAAVTAVLGVLDDEAPAVGLWFPTAKFAVRSRAYTGWVFVKGTGILDKQSFIPARGAATSTSVEAPDAKPAPVDHGGWSPFGLLAVGSFAVAAVLIVLAAARRGRRN